MRLDRGTRMLRRLALAGLLGLALPSVSAAQAMGSMAGMAGMAGDEAKAFVREVQNLLAKAGYFDAKDFDGRLGPRTREAIARFQKDNGLPPDGRMTPELYNRLAAKAR
jgi:peptidoglycan hydrolase-like protein with peptidoglycan-binding domain